MGRCLAIALLLLACLRPAPAEDERHCGAMDIVVVLDTSGSMSGALLALKFRMGTLMERLVALSDGDLRLGLIGFNDRITVLRDLGGPPGPDQIAPFLVALGSAIAWGGDQVPELSAESLNTLLNGLRADGRAQIGDFNGRYEALNRIAILLTDQLPGGFDDVHGAEDLALVDDVIGRALDLDVRISAVYVPTDPWPNGEVEAVMRRYADDTGGVYAFTDRRGTGVPQALIDIIETCGRGALM